MAVTLIYADNSVACFSAVDSLFSNIILVDIPHGPPVSNCRKQGRKGSWELFCGDENTVRGNCTFSQYSGNLRFTRGNNFYHGLCVPLIMQSFGAGPSTIFFPPALNDGFLFLRLLQFLMTFPVATNICDPLKYKRRFICWEKKPGKW